MQWKGLPYLTQELKLNAFTCRQRQQQPSGGFKGLGSRTVDGLNVGSDLVNELRQLLKVHGGPIPGVLHILDALQCQRGRTSQEQ